MPQRSLPRFAPCRQTFARGDPVPPLASAAAGAAAYDEEDNIGFMLADTRLHSALARIGGFTTSITGLQGLRDEVHLFRLDHPLSSAEMSDVLEEHTHLLGAIEAHDKSRAESAAIQHLEATRARIDGAEAGEAARNRDELVTLGR